MTNITGGYYLLTQDLVRAGRHKHTAAHPDCVSDSVLRAVNILQAVPRKINAWLLDTMREAWLSGDGLGGLPSAYNEELPERLPEETWHGMTKVEKDDYKLNLVGIHTRNAKRVGRREAFLRKLNIAETYRDEGAIWFPHFIDFRGRMYPMPQDLQPQGDDVARSLLEFSDGKRLGATGLYWLAVRLANTFGEDKAPFDDRLRWALDNEKLIFDSAQDPLDGERFWCEADEPWEFLATCREWHEAHQERTPEDYVSHLPVPMDGTCNGLQHLSLMGRDRAGAEATNCCRADVRNDLYQQVADEVIRIVKDDLKAGDALASEWLARGIDRKVVKRAVMTTPYGVTKHGIREQLVNDGHCFGIGANHRAAAGYMQEKISEALGRTVSKAKQIMAWYQEVADAFAEENLPLTWTTPVGMKVIQSYYQLSRREVKTLVGRIILWHEDEELGISPRKQVLAASPNIVHSFDAAMLAETIIRCHDWHGISSLAAIHDSYGTHACDTGTLHRTLREVAYEMYQPNRLEELHTEWSSELDVPPPPAVGDLDVSEVLEAPFFFA